MSLIKSVSESDKEILEGVARLYLPEGEWFDLDPCYSKGLFYKDLPSPRYKFDLVVQADGVVQADVMALPIKSRAIGSIIFDPPFMFGTHGQTKNNIMTKRFSMFDTYEELENMYKGALREFHRVLKPKGIVAYKCQDYTDSYTTLTHCLVHRWATELGFYAEDLFILVCTKGRIWNPNLKQRHARKFHSYWFVFRKK